MYLIEAEANYFLNEPAKAQAALVALNATSGRDPSYTCTKTGTALFDEIVLYRELELWGEGSNWNDYKRWKKDVVRVPITSGGICHAAYGNITAASSDWCWAIPEVETLYNKAFSSETPETVGD